MTFFIELNKQTKKPKIYIEFKKTNIKVILNRNYDTRDSRIFDLKLYYSAITTEKAWYRHKLQIWTNEIV